MAINFETADPQKLLTTFKRLIDEKKVVTWSYDRDEDFTHVTSSDQWEGKAWLRPSIYNGRLVMNIVGNKNVITTHAIYGVYHGRFIESMLTHCDRLFTAASATSMATNADVITQAA